MALSRVISAMVVATFCYANVEHLAQPSWQLVDSVIRGSCSFEVIYKCDGTQNHQHVK